MPVDIVEVVAHMMGLSSYEVFAVACRDLKISTGRMEMFWVAYVTEDYILEDISDWCLMKIQN